MKWAVNGGWIELRQGDITAEHVDAIVNAANPRLAGGGGVDGAIHRAGGPEIMAETSQRYPDGCETGGAVISGAGNLAAKFVIHAVGPVYEDGEFGEPDLLASAYRECLRLASEHSCSSIAFPAISCGAYGYPIREASEISLSIAAQWLKQQDKPNRIVFVLFDRDTFKRFSSTADELLGEREL